MKINKTTCAVLVAASTMGANVYADSFADSLKNGKFSAQIKNIYVFGSHTDANKEAGSPANDANVGNTAISAHYETADYNGLKFGLAFQHSWDWELDDDPIEDDARGSISSTALEEAYVDYTFDKETTATNIKVGRQHIKTPLVMTSPQFPMEDSFDAVVITNKDLPKTTLRFAYLDDWIKRYGNDSNGSAGQEDVHFNDDVYFVHLINKSLPGLKLEGQYLVNDSTAKLGDGPTAGGLTDSYTTSYLAFDYKIPNTSWSVGAKTLEADFDNNTDSGYWGVKAKTKLAGYGIQLGYVAVDDEANFPGTLGHVPQTKQFKGPGYVNEIFAGLKTTSIVVDNNFGIKGFNAKASYAMWDQSDEGIANSGKDFDGGSELAFDLKYKFQDVKGLSTRLRIGFMDFDKDAGDDDFTYGRLFLNYKF